MKGHGDYRPTSFTRSAPKLKGRGDYASDLGGLGHAIGSGVGTVVDLGKKALSLFGIGDYHAGLRKNSLIGAGSKQMQPAGFNSSQDGLKLKGSIMQFHGANGGSDGGFRFTKVEMVQPVIATGTTDFSTKVFRIQPGLKGNNVLFPMGSTIASCFQKYKLHGMVMTYQSSSSPYSSQVGVGTVYLSTLYDVEASPLVSEAEVSNNVYTTFGRPFDSIVHGIECDSKENPISIRYVRKGNVSTVDSDERFDDVGLFQVSMVGVSAAAGVELGKVFVTYDIEFIQPTLPDLHIGTTWHGELLAAAGPAPVLNAPQFKLDPTNSLPVKVDGANLLRLPMGYNGNYFLIICADGGSELTPSAAPSINAIGSDVKGLNFFPVAATGQFSPVFRAGGGAQVFMIYAFSTIAENPLQNWIQLNYPFGNWSSTAATIDATIAILPLDNDTIPDFSSPLATALAAFSKKERKNVEKFVALQEALAAPPRRLLPTPSSSSSAIATVSRRVSLGEIVDVGHLDAAKLGPSYNGIPDGVDPSMLASLLSRLSGSSRP